MSLFGFLKHKKEGEDAEQAGESNENADGSEKINEQKQESIKVSENASGDIVKLATEIEKINANIEAFKEVRQSTSERFNRITEQVGELRAMILDRDRTVQEIELKAVKAADLVQSVEPEKLMSSVQKQDVKIEVLKANLEGNEAISSKIMDELKEFRRKLEFFSGVEEIIKLSEDVKKELIDIKKVEGRIESNADKVDTIYTEMRKKMTGLDIVETQLAEDKAFAEQNSKDIDFIKTKISGLVDKDELDKVVKKVQKYTDSLSEMEKKTSMTKDLDELKIMLESMK